MLTPDEMRMRSSFRFLNPIRVPMLNFALLRVRERRRIQTGGSFGRPLMPSFSVPLQGPIHRIGTSEAGLVRSDFTGRNSGNPAERCGLPEPAFPLPSGRRTLPVEGL